MKSRTRRWMPWLVACVGFAGVWLAASAAHLRLVSPALITGWTLLGLIAVLASFNGRKRLAMLPIGSASTWLRWHLAAGVLAWGVFWLHAGSLWPMGRHEQALAIAFHTTQLSGLFGWILQAVVPGQLTRTGRERVFERIPEELSRLRAEAESEALASVRPGGTGMVARLHQETLAWFFERPRFQLDHLLLGGKRARAWIDSRCTSVRQFLGADEIAHLDRIAALAGQKGDLDFHHAGQAALKGWLFIHIPAAVSLVLLSLWHVALVHLFAK